MSLPESTELIVARAAAEAGGQVVARYFGQGLAMRSKESYNLVSDADVQAEEAVVRVIRRSFPDHAVLAEEKHSAEIDQPHLWVVDPLDGTNNFAHNIPHFAVSVAYYREGRPQIGVVHNPVRGEWFQAVRGAGAWAQDRRVQVDGARQLDQVLVGLGFYYDRGAMMEATLLAMRDLFRAHVHGIRRFGTASLDLCWVGQGNFGAFFEYELSPWDFAAAALFVQEAGGCVTTCQGQPLPLLKGSVLASNGHLHAAMLEVVQRHWKG
jgi:myo-inositol-1(or 4)-monophosphatase